MTTAERILEILKHDSLTVTQVAVEIGDVSRSTVFDVMERLHKARRIRIADWSLDGHRAAIYRAGAGKDKEPPPLLTPAERQRRYREAHATEIRLRRAAKRAPRSDSPIGLHPVGLHFIQLLQR